jgi:hypothetical protein
VWLTAGNPRIKSPIATVAPVRVEPKKTHNVALNDTMRMGPMDFLASAVRTMVLMKGLRF